MTRQNLCFDVEANCTAGDVVAVGKRYALAVATRRQRRFAVSWIIEQLCRVLEAETNYCDNIPDNLVGSARYEAAEQCVDALAEACEALEGAFDD